MQPYLSALAAFTRVIDAVNEHVGRVASWLALLMVLLQFIVVVLRYIFGVGFIAMQEGVIYLHATLFMVGAGYTLLHGGHVRVDIFYRDARPRRRALVDLLGVILFLLPVCVVIGWASWPYLEQSWSVFEGSKETSGIHAVYALKSMIMAFVVLIALQGLSLGLHAALTLAGLEERHDATAETGGEAV
ncbi:MAG: TRAP transporter small permease subunit [Rhodospirillales bacterium]|nr:TRAP transporter small permease subunit [Rhodospirillales bacterium]